MDKTAVHPSAKQPLAGLEVVVTRPADQAARLAELIRDAGGQVILYPVISIEEVEDPRGVNEVIDRLEQFDMAVFISPNAARRAMKMILARRSLPPGLRCVAVGQGTVRELRGFGVNSVIAPRERFDSEGLLDLPEMQQVAGKRVAIFRGDGGRELLADTLIQRGARVEYVTCYRRGRPASTPEGLIHQLRPGKIQAVALTSSEGMRNLWDMIGERGQRWLRDTPVFVTHARIASTARSLGLNQVLLTSPGDEGLLQGMVAWFASRSGKTGKA